MKGLLVIALLLLPIYCYGVVINEVAWMGTKEDYNKEWIELYNSSNEKINLENWVLKTKDEDIKISLKGRIPAKGFFLLERTDDSSVPEVKADLIYKGSLSNKGEYLLLLDSKGKVIDEVDCSSGWIAGNNNTKQTMELFNNSWHTSQEKGGTPKKKNSIPKKPEKVDKTEKQNDSFSSDFSSLSASIVALTIAFLSALIVFILKKSLKKKI